MQVRGAGIPPTHPGTWPDAWNSTAFNVDYALAIRRLCFEGKETWLGNGYVAGDNWGCVGRWFSGDWYVNSQNYINIVEGHMQNKPWVGWGYPGI
jgi:autotransporter family porin